MQYPTRKKELVLNEGLEILDDSAYEIHQSRF